MAHAVVLIGYTCFLVFTGENRVRGMESIAALDLLRLSPRGAQDLFKTNAIYLLKKSLFLFSNFSRRARRVLT